MKDTSPHGRRLQRTVVAGFLVLVVGLATLGVLVFERMAEMDSAREWVEHTRNVLGQLDQTEEVLTSAEGALRGYLLSGDAGFLATLSTDDRRLRQLLATLHQLTRDNVAEQERIVRIADAFAIRMARTREIDRARRARPGPIQLGAASRAYDATASDRIHVLLGDMQASEREFLAERLEREDSADSAIRWIVVGGVAFAAIVALLSVLGLRRDVAARERAEQTVREVGQRFRAIFNSGYGLVWLLARDGRVLEANRPSLVLLGLTSGDVAGMPFTDTPWWARNADVRDQLRAAVAAAAGGEHTQFSAEVTPTAHTSITLAFAVTPVLHRDTGVVDGIIVEGYDITARTRAERLKDDLIAVVSHEIRNPLTALKGALGLLQIGLGTLPPKEAQLFDLSVRNTDRLIRLVNDLLDLARLESGMDEPRRAPIDAGAVIAQVCEFSTPLAESAGIVLTCNGAGVTANADPDRLAQVLTNLIGNAIKFAPRGSTVRAWAERVGGAVRFSVSDQGRGIPPDQLEQVFGEFKQVERGDAKEKGGTGLGLAISRAIVRQHGGRIWAESEVGKGSTFQFTIPDVPQPPGPKPI